MDVPTTRDGYVRPVTTLLRPITGQYSSLTMGDDEEDLQGGTNEQDRPRYSNAPSPVPKMFRATTYCGTVRRVLDSPQLCGAAGSGDRVG